MISGAVGVLLNGEGGIGKMAQRGNRVLWFGIGFGLVLLCICGLGSLLLLRKAWSPVIQPLPTPGVAGFTFEDLFWEADARMGMDRDAFLYAAIGKRVHGNVAVDFMDSDGTLWAHVGYGHTVIVKGFSGAALAAFKRHQVIGVEGTITGWNSSGSRLFVDKRITE